MKTKQEIRRSIREAFSRISQQELSAMNKAVCQKIIQRVHAERKSRMNILLYCSLPDEAQTWKAIETLNQEGHNILLPVVSGDEMVIKPYQGSDSMKSGAFNIAEPSGDEFSDYTLIDLAFIPGRAFTEDGRRLGRGRGYYDRFLGEINCPKIGVALPFQIVRDLPCEPHDIPLDEVL